MKHFFHCRWWSRGWTLQELLAPHVYFYSKKWDYYTSRSKVEGEISTFTGIPMAVLCGKEDLSTVCVAARMS